MNRIEKKFRELKRKRRKALSVFLTAGYPSLSATEKLVPELADSGVDLFEIGFPFSDPIADGPTIQASSEAALRKGMTWNKVLALGRSIRKRSDVPLILMSYANPLYCRGWERSVDDLSRAGFDGAIIPDLIPEENEELRAIFRNKGLSLIYLLAPTSTLRRIRAVSTTSSGFIYCVSVAGVTGARKSLPNEEIKSFLRKVRRESSIPILLGFGISNPEQMKTFAGSADGFIIGSALIKVLARGGTLDSLIQRAKKFINPFSLRNGHPDRKRKSQ